ncbi:hypothetical protein DOTSEDRAFT_73705 [Lecanosticta acicola]|uniref:Uncharacterized protein n=1 Tax=Lecanosticta acicola TaxID=111012 RepID=A0AAI9ED01_9PEZI|nr:hypothetical protein DOTSEDRAFT_73705 [Lecanosticta acicola]
MGHSFSRPPSPAHRRDIEASCPPQQPPSRPHANDSHASFSAEDDRSFEQEGEEDDRAKRAREEISKLDDEYEWLHFRHGPKIDKFGDAVQPHTDEGGEPYFIGDAYQDINPVFASEWAIPNPGPYLRYVKQLAQTWKHLEYLCHWMEVTCAPPKWKFLRREQNAASREERAARTKVRVIDYTNASLDASEEYYDCATLRRALDDSRQTTDARQTRLIIAEDLSRDLVETLGDYYDVDPLFFASHIGDYLFHNTRDRWAELPTLDADARKMPHFCLSYLRGRYYEREEDFEEAERQTGMFNVLRRLDSDRSRKRLQNGLIDTRDASVALSRAKTSLWCKPRKQGDPITAILLVDPTVGHGHPLWGGYRPFTQTPSMQSWRDNPYQSFDAPERKSLFEDVVYWSERMTAQDLALADRDPRCLALSMLKLVIADWLTVLKYMTSTLGKLEWELEVPHWGRGGVHETDRLLKKLSPWRRNVGYYETMISQAIARLFPPEVRAPLHTSAPAGANAFDTPLRPPDHYWSYDQSHDTGIRSLWLDFQNVKRQMDEVQARIRDIEQIAFNASNIEESRRAVEQNRSIGTLTFLATIFIPLNFTSSFLSISADFSEARTTVLLWFAIGIPLTVLTLLVLNLLHRGRKGYLLKALRKWLRESVIQAY